MEKYLCFSLFVVLSIFYGHSLGASSKKGAEEFLEHNRQARQATLWNMRKDMSRKEEQLREKFKKSEKSENTKSSKLSIIIEEAESVEAELQSTSQLVPIKFNPRIFSPFSIDPHIDVTVFDEDGMSHAADLRAQAVAHDLWSLDHFNNQDN